jgi:hypothetical protein
LILWYIIYLDIDTVKAILINIIIKGVGTANRIIIVGITVTDTTIANTISYSIIKVRP